jgi:CRP-like cAMP-binding protein
LLRRYGKPRAATVIALTEGRLWALDRSVFRSVVVKSNNAQARKDIIHLLQRVELLQALTLTQFQRLADLLNEVQFKAGDYIIRQGEMGEHFYLIMSGLCDCTKSSENGAEVFLVQRKEHEYFGERALLSNEPRAANVKAVTDVRLLCINKSAFDEVLGSLSDIINKDRLRREALADAVNMSSSRLEGVSILGLVTVDNLGPILMGSFGSYPARISSDQINGTTDSKTVLKSITIRSFVLSEIDANNLSSSAIKFLEAVKTCSVPNTQKLIGTAFLPHMTTISKDSNAVHLIFDEAVVADLSSLIKASTKEGTLACNKEIYSYVAASAVCALETLHSFGIIYRAVQPEGIYVTHTGKLVFMDFRVCKVGGVGARYAN